MTTEQMTNMIHDAWEKFTHAPYPDIAFYELFEQAIITATKDKDRENVKRYQKLRCWHQRVEVRYWTGEYWEPLISDKLDAMLDGISDYRSV